MEHKEAYKRLENLETLKENWDGYGAPVVNKESIANTRKLLEIINIPVQVFVTGDGIVQLEGYTTEGVEFEIEVLPNTYFLTLWEDVELLYEMNYDSVVVLCDVLMRL